MGLGLALGPGEHPVSTDTEFGCTLREFESMVRRDTYEIYTSSWRPRLGCLERLGDDHGCERSCSWRGYFPPPQFMHNVEITELQSADRRRQRAMSDLLETDRRRREEMRELRAAIALDISRYPTLTLYRHYRERRFYTRYYHHTARAVTAYRDRDDIAGAVTVLRDSRTRWGSAQPGYQRTTGSSFLD
ncbi:hypothetical protein Tco_1122990 [Tanacetum coccineum]|uniref:Uncharacterized protein n=1 Tax=Tanacetum coccineum TaxID=301880 RepID=A0ABQ5J3S5_9ASTR